MKANINAHYTSKKLTRKEEAEMVEQIKMLVMNPRYLKSLNKQRKLDQSKPLTEITEAKGANEK